MSTRKIKDAELDGEKVYFKGHAKATFMSDGKAVEEAINEKQDVTTIVDHGTGDTTFALTPNVFHVWGEVASLSLTLAAPSDSTVYNEYMFEFVSGSTATTLILPDTVEWVEGVPSVESGKTYQVSIVDNIGLIVGV